MTLETLKVEFTKLGKEGYELYTDGLIGRLYRITKRAKYGKKQVWGYRFKNETQMLNYITEQFEDLKTILGSKEEMKNKRKTQAQTDAQNVQVGDIFVSSWGYEQTNVDLFQVIAKKGKATVIVRPISYETVEETSWCSENVRAIPDSFCGEERTHRLNGAGFKISSFQYASKLENKSAKIYRSWGY